MRWIGQHIYDFISRFRNDVYLEDISTGTIASGGNLGLDSNNKIVKATVSGGGVDFSGLASVAPTDGDKLATLDADGSTEQLTDVHRLAELFAGTGLTASASVIGVDASQTQITSVGTIGTGEWRGTDINGAYIADDTIDSQHYTDGSIDTAHIADAQITVAKLHADAIQTSSEAFADNDTTLMTSAAIQDKIYGTTVVGTIATGTWQGTAVATDQQKHLADFEFEGFSVGDGTNYMIPEINSDTKAPFEHQTSTGSDGLTATTVIRLLRTSGHVMPYAGTLKLWKGWATSSGTGQTVDIGLYKFTLVNNDSTDVSPVALKNTSFTSVGNAKALSFSESSFSVAFSAGDILISAIRNGTNNKKCEFTSTLVVEWD